MNPSDKSRNGSTSGQIPGPLDVDSLEANFRAASSLESTNARTTGVIRNQPSSRLALHPFDTQKHRRNLIRLGVIGLLIVVGLVFILLRHPGAKTTLDASKTNAAQRYNVQSIPLTDLTSTDGLTVQNNSTLSINGQLNVNNGLVLSPISQPGAPVAGQLYFDQTTNNITYYNGKSYQTLLPSTSAVQSIAGVTGNLTVGDGISVANNKLANTGVLSVGSQTGVVGLGDGLTGANGSIRNSGVLTVQGQAGNVSLTAGGGIAISGTTISSTGVTALAGQHGDIALGNGLSVSGGTLSNSGILSASGGGSVTVTNDGNGNITISSAVGSGTVSSAGGTANKLARFTGVQTIADSLISDDGTAVTVGSDLNVTGNLNLTVALSVANGGTGASNAAGARTNLGVAASGANSDITSLSGLTSALTVAQGGTGVGTLATNGVLIGNGVNGLTSVVAGAAGLCLVSTGGSPAFQACPGGGGGVTSIDGLNGVLTLANSSGAGNTVTINDATTAAKGIASFNASNFLVAGGAVNTVQNIAVTATPTFAGLTLTSPLTTANGGTGANNAGSARTNLGAAASGANGDITSLTGLTTALSVSQGGTGLATLTANQLLFASNASAISQINNGASGLCLVSNGAGAAPSFQVCTGAGGVSSLNGQTGAVTLANATAAAGTVTINDAKADGATKGIAAFNSTNFSAAAGVINTIQGIATTSSPTFGGLTLTSALTIGNGGTGATSLATNGVIIGQGAGALTAVTAGGSGLCLISTAGAPVFGACPGSGGVASINGLVGAVTIANATGAGATVTIDDATTVSKGIASFNSTNFTVSSGAVNTIQNINTTAAPTFGQLALTSSQAANPMLVVNNTNAAGSGNLLDLQLNGSSKLSVAPSGNTAIAGTLSVGTINGQTISAAANFTGSVAVSTGLTVGTTLGVNTITPSGALTIGANGQSFTLQGNTSSIIKSTNGTTTTSLAFQNPTADVTYNFATAAAGSYDVCTTAGNCFGGGAGVTTPGGTLNKLAKFTGATSLGDSLISDNGTVVTIAGNLAVNTIAPTGALTVGVTGQNLTLQGATVSLASTNAGITNNLTFATPTGSNKTITLPDATGTVAVSASGPLSLDAFGNLSCATCLASGGGGAGGVVSLNTLTGALVLQGVSAGSITSAGSTLTVNDATSGIKGLASFNATNLTVSSGNVNTVQDIAVTSTPTFAGLTLTSALTVANGGTGATNATNARTNLSAAKSGANSDITSLTGLSTALSVAQGGTGVTTTANNGEILIGNGSGYSVNTLTAGSGVTIDNSLAGHITISAPGSGTCAGCAATSLNNLASVAINTSLLPGSAGAANLGSGALPFGQLFLSGTSASPATNNFNITGVSTGGTRTITLPDASGTVAVSASGNIALSAAGNIAFTGTLGVTNGGTGLSSFTANQLVYANTGTSLSQLSNGSGGQCLVSNGAGSAPSFQACTGAGGVSSLNGQNGAVTLDNASGAANHVTIDNAKADGATKGIAAFNTTNFSAAAGVINTAQDIATSSNVSFNSINSATLLQTNSTTRIDASGNLSNIGTINASGLATLGNGLTVSAGTITLNNLTGGSSKCLTLDGSNHVGVASCATGSGSTPTFQNIYDNSGASPIITVNTTGNGVKIQDASTPIGADLFAVTNNSGATKYFAVTVAGASVTGTLSATNLSGNGSGVTNVNAAQLNGQAASYYLNATNINAGTLGDTYLSSNVALYNRATSNFTGALQHSGNNVCDTSGNCTGVAGGAIGGSGTLNKIPVFTGSGYTIGDSMLSQDVGVTTVTVSNKLTATGLITASNGLTVSAGTVTLNNLTGGSSTCLTLDGSNHVGTATCATGTGSTPTLQDVYNNSSTTPVITLNSTGKGVFIQDASTTVGGNLFAVQSNAGAATYFGVTTNAANLNVPTVGTNQSTISLFNATATTVNAFGAAATINLGAAGTTIANSGAIFLQSGTANQDIQTIVVKSNAAQNGDLFEVQSSLGNLLSGVMANGEIWSAPGITIPRTQIPAARAYFQANAAATTGLLVRASLLGNGIAADGPVIQAQNLNGTANIFTVGASGIVTLAGGQTQDVTTASAGTSTALTVQPGNSTTNSGTGSALNLSGSNQTGTTSTGGAVNVSGGSGTSTVGAVNIQSSINGATNINTGTSTGAVSIGNSAAGAISLTTASTISLQGGVRIGGSGMDTFTTPQGASVNAKINVALMDPGANGQTLALGLQNGANATARAISVFDNRAAGAQPAIALFAPDEGSVVGFSWQADNTVARVMTSFSSSPSGASDGILVQSGNSSGTSSTTGQAIVQSGAITAGGSGTTGPVLITSGSTVSGASGNVTITTGNGSGSAAGNVIIDAGSASGASNGQVLIGGTNSVAVQLGRAGVTTTNIGAFNVGASAGNGSFVNNGSTQNAVTTQSTGVSTSISNINSYTSFLLTATVGSLTYTLPDPSPTTAGKIVYISNASSGSNTFTLAPTNGASTTVNTDTTATMQWNGSRWTLAGTGTAGSSGVTTVGTFNAGTSYANGAQIVGNTITFGAADGTNPGLVSTGAQTIAGDKTLTGNSTFSGTMLQKTDSATGFQIQNAAGGTNRLLFDASTNTLKVYDPSSAAYAYISYASGVATFGASSGTAQVGSGTGDVAISLTHNSEKLNATHTGTAAGSTDTDFIFQRNITGGASNLQGNVMKVEDISTTSATNSVNVLYINQQAGTSGNLILAQTGGSVTKFAVSQAGNITLASGASVTGLGALSITSAAASALNFGTTNTNAITIGSTANNPSISLESGTSAISIGTAASARTINIGTGAANQTITIGSTSSTTAFALQNGTGTVNLFTSASARAINFANGGAAQTLAIANGNVANIVTLGSTNASATLALQGGGGINIGTAAAQPVTIGAGAGGALRLGQNAGSLQIDGPNFDVATTGAVTLLGGLSTDISTQVAGGTGDALTVAPGTSTGASTNGAATTIKGGDGSGTTTVTGGSLNLQGGSATGASGTRNGGNVVIDAGTGTTANGTVSIGTTSAATVTIGSGTSTAAAVNIQGNASSIFSATNATGTTVLGFAAPSTAGTVTFQLPNGGTGGNTYQICTTLTVCSGYGAGGSSLQAAYNASGVTDPQIQLSNANGGFKIRDASSSTISNLLQFQNSTGTTTYLGLTTSTLTLGSAGASVGLSLAGSAGTISNTQTQTHSESFGAGATVSNSDSVAVGYNASGGINGVAVGSSSNAQGNGTALGKGAVADSGGTAIGTSATTAGFTDSIALGRGAVASANNQLVIGAGGSQISQVIIGNGTSSLTPSSVTIQATGGNGSNIAGGSMTLTSGQGTGTAASGNLYLTSASNSGVNTSSGDVNIDVGTATGTGTAGTVYIGNSNAHTIEIASNNGVDHTIHIGYASGNQAVYLGSDQNSSLTDLAAGAGGMQFTYGSLMTSALTMQATGGTKYFVLDNLDSRIYIGNPTPDASAFVFVVDNSSGSDPTGVNGAMYYNTDTQSFRCYENSAWVSCIGGLLSANTAPSSAIANTNTETDFSLNYGMPAGYCTQGRVIRWTAQGTYSTTGTPTLTFKLKGGSTALASSPALTTANNAANREWRIEGQTICDAAPSGTSATETQGQAILFTANNATTPGELANTATTNLATNGAITLQMSATWSAASASNTVTMRQFIVEGMGP